MRPILLCLGAALLFGAATPLSKQLLEPLGGLALASLLYLGAAIAVLPFSFTRSATKYRTTRKQLGFLLGAIVFGGILGPILLLFGLAQSSAASVALWLNLEAVATALLAWVFFREFIGRRTWMAVALVVVAGIVLSAGDLRSELIPGLLVAGACICWGLDNNFTSLIDGFTPEQSTLVKGVVAGSFNLVLAFSLSSPKWSYEVVLQALAVGGVCYGASITLYIRGAQELGATRSQLLFSFAPFVGVLGAWVFLGEDVQTVQIAAGVLMILGAFLLLESNHQHKHTHQATTHTHSHRHDDAHHKHEHSGGGESGDGWHSHSHSHEKMSHSHQHLPDLHHRHDHKSSDARSGEAK